MDDDTTISCRETTLMVCGARDEALTEAQLQSLQQHLAGCDACQVASRQFADVFAQMDALFARGEGTESGGG